MKKPISQCIRSFSFVFTCLPLVVAVASAAPAAKPQDPFSRRAPGHTQGGSGDSECVVAIGLQLAHVPAEHVRAWDEERLGGADMHKRFTELVRQGRAHLAESIAGAVEPGKIARIRDTLEMHTPVEYTPVAGRSPFPTEFMSRDVGISLEVEVEPMPAWRPGTPPDRLLLNLAFEWSRQVGAEMDNPGTGGPRQRAVQVPVMEQQQVTTQASMRIGQYSELARVRPLGQDMHEDAVVIVFGRVDLVGVEPVSRGQTSFDAGHTLQFRASWVDLEASLWHQMLAAHSLSSLFGGTAWDSVLAWEHKGRAKVFSSVVIGAENDNLARIQVGEPLYYQDVFPLPGSSEEMEPITLASRFHGQSLELDAQLDENGVIRLQLNAESSSFCGWDESFWKEAIDDTGTKLKFPRFYDNSNETVVLLGRDMNLLVGVGTPSKENGQPDTERKRLLFIHNDTFRTN